MISGVVSPSWSVEFNSTVVNVSAVAREDVTVDVKSSVGCVCVAFVVNSVVVGLGAIVDTD